jgi:hypothetical protein
MGAIVTVVSIFLAISLANRLLAREPLPVSEALPTIIVLTAPPTAPPTATAVLELPTPVPTFTPIPTPDNALAPPEVTVGFYAQVTGTEVGLTVRGGPSTSNAQVTSPTMGPCCSSSGVRRLSRLMTGFGGRWNFRTARPDGSPATSCCR